MSSLKSDSTTPRSIGRFQIREVPANSMLVYPLVISSRTMGLLYGDRAEPTLGFELSDLNSLKTLINQSILAIKQGAK